MAVIDPSGLFKGKRLRKCSPKARLYWPYLFLLSNGYARIELDYEAIGDEFSSFRETAPTSEEVREILTEFSANHLLFVYGSNDQQWGQWDTRSSQLKEYKTAADKNSPAPPEDEYCQWLKEQHGEAWPHFHWDRNIGVSGSGKDLDKTSPGVDQDLGLGVGVGVGVGKGKGKEKLDEPFPDNFDGSEWALRTFKAYPTWNDPSATVAPARLSDAYMATIEAEAPSRGGLLKTAEWFLEITQEFARQSAGKDPQFIMGLEKFLRQGYVEVKLPRANSGKHIPKESDEECEKRLRREGRERRRAANAAKGVTATV